MAVPMGARPVGVSSWMRPDKDEIRLAAAHDQGVTGPKVPVH